MDVPSEKVWWVDGLPVGEPMKDDLARLLEEHPDEIEWAVYEAAADPVFVSKETARRRYRGMFRRRLRHLQSRARDRQANDRS